MRMLVIRVDEQTEKVLAALAERRGMSVREATEEVLRRAADRMLDMLAEDIARAGREARG